MNNCCGRKRAEMQGSQALGLDGVTPMRFSYAGVKTIRVRGGATGRLYSFAPGATLRVHGLDAESMQDIPGLASETSPTL